MAIVQNVPCPECQASGHDSTGNHLMVFDDGARLCTRTHFHASGERLYIPPDGDDPILKSEITGKIKYTQEQFNTLFEEGKLENPLIRKLALSGMRKKDAYACMSQKERNDIEMEWGYDLDYFNRLKFKNLTTRGIRGNWAKMYNVRVGLDANGAVERHYYPRYSAEPESWGRLEGAMCRTLPKDFKFGTLGKTFGNQLLFGQETVQVVMDSGRRRDKLIITGGQLDVLAAQQMLMESQAGTKYKDQLFHIWSPNKGEMAVDEILYHKDEINKFNQILIATDDDEVGNALALEINRIFRGKCKRMRFGKGCKDPNQCLLDGRHKEFVDSYWNPEDVVVPTGMIKSIGQLKKGSLETPTMGLSWPWPELNPLTFGIRTHWLCVLGAGTGVGKTETSKEIAFHLADLYGEQVGLVYLEEPVVKTVRSFAGKLVNKRLEEPPIHDKSDAFYNKASDYTDEEATEAIEILEAKNNVFIADTGGDKRISTVLEILEQFLAMGVTRIIVDNLTAIEMEKGGSKVEAIDDAMKRLGTFKDERPVSIFLISHLTRPQSPRTPHENGGEVLVNDFRGAGSITFWANVVIGIERNTNGATEEEKRTTTYRIVKCRDRGISTGSTVSAYLHPDSGRLLSQAAHSTYASKQRSKPKPQPKPEGDTAPWDEKEEEF